MRLQQGKCLCASREDTRLGALTKPGSGNGKMETEVLREHRLSAWKTSGSGHDRRKDAGEAGLQVQTETGWE